MWPFHRHKWWWFVSADVKTPYGTSGRLRYCPACRVLQVDNPYNDFIRWERFRGLRTDHPPSGFRDRFSTYAIPDSVISECSRADAEYAKAVQGAVSFPEHEGGEVSLT